MVELPPPAQPTVAAIYDALVKDAAWRDKYEGYGIGASLLGSPCDRQLWMTLRWASPPEVITQGRKFRIFARGNAAEDRILGDLKLAGLHVEEVDPETGKQWRLSRANGWLRGKADARCWGVLEAPNAMHVVEIKCIKAADWRAIAKHGLRKQKPEHWMQLHEGMAALGIERGLYIAENADTCELLTERIHLDYEEAARQEARVLRLVEEHDAPLKIADAPKTPPCLFCNHRALCFENASPRRHCRTCIFFRFGTDGNGHCDRFNEPRSPERQRAGAQCPAQRLLPTLIPGEQIDAADDGSWIEYRLLDGTIWRDGADVSDTPITLEN
jgi:hypothetical protein